MNKAAGKVIRLSKNEINSLTRDAKIVSIRWDLVDWGLVLDLDVSMSESHQSLVRKAWLFFEAISDIDIPLNEVRIPNGCFLTSNIATKQLEDGFRIYSFNALLPKFDIYDEMTSPMTKCITIKAQNISGVITENMTAVNEFGFLDRKKRLDLATDEEMLMGLMKS